MFTIWAPLTILTSVAAWVDVQREVIPNTLSLVAASIGIGLVLGHQLAWTALLWAGSIWALFEIGMWSQPDKVGWGDAKWSAITMGYLGGLGLPVIAAGFFGSFLWGTVRWWKSGRVARWGTFGGPWAPGAWVGLLIIGGLRLWHG